MERFTKNRLSADARPKELFIYWVTGKGAFPFDMLRYDAAWPADTDSALNMDSDWVTLRSVKLFGNREPTIGRWLSFGWSVGKEKL